MKSLALIANRHARLIVVLAASACVADPAFAAGAPVAPPSLKDAMAHYVRVSPRDSRYLELSDGSPYIPNGLNVIHPGGGVSTEEGLAQMEKWMKALADNGGNYIRIWMSSPFWDPEHGTSHRETRSRVKITVFSMTPGYHGVDSDFFRECETTGRENLLRWPGVPDTELEDDSRLIAALRDRLGDDFDLYGDSGESDQQKFENIIRTAVRFGESSREVETLGLSDPSALRFLALPRLYSGCICPGELVRLRNELNQAADQGECSLLLVPHPDDPQPAHQAVTEAALRALDPALKWHIWYYQSPWYRMSPYAIDAIVPLNDEELYRKRAAAETHRSQTIRTPYGKYVMSGASLNADILPELLLGFGGKHLNVFGKYCEVFQMRLRPFYTCDQTPPELLICADEPLPIDAALPCRESQPGRVGEPSS